MDCHPAHRPATERSGVRRTLLSQLLTCRHLLGAVSQSRVVACSTGNNGGNLGKGILTLILTQQWVKVFLTTVKLLQLR